MSSHWARLTKHTNTLNRPTNISIQNRIEPETNLTLLNSNPQFLCIDWAMVSNPVGEAIARRGFSDDLVGQFGLQIVDVVLEAFVHFC